MQELLLLHLLEVPFALRRSLRSTNTIEGLFSGVQFYEKNIRQYRSSTMSKRWLGTVLLSGEKGFRKIRGYQFISKIRTAIAQWQKRFDTMSCTA